MLEAAQGEANPEKLQPGDVGFLDRLETVFLEATRDLFFGMTLNIRATIKLKPVSSVQEANLMVLLPFYHILPVLQ